MRVVSALRCGLIAVRAPVFAVAAMLMTSLQLSAAPTPTPRAVLSADADWKFVVGDPAGVEAPSFDDHAWRTVTVPHDWSIEGVVNEKNPTGLGGGYFPSGVAWYRKTFTAPAIWKGKRVSLEFDGVASNATIYLNGQKVDFHPYAYTSFYLDITSQLKLASKNILAVRVDDSEQPDSRWYSGSGIYRHVRVVVTEPIRVAPWGVFVSSPEVSTESAKVSIKTDVQNDASETGEFAIRTILLNPAGSKCGESDQVVRVGTGAAGETAQQITVKQPALWSPGSPRLYRAITRVMRNGKVIDEVETSFGIRSLAWSVEKGLLLNGAPIKLVGGSVHHDNGPLGAAAFDRAEERKVQLLKAAGFNAVRSAHNPPSPAFLDACDRLGLLVVDEPFDVWTISKRKYDYARFFNDWWERDIDAMVKRDRNHPSIVMWGIGNEIPEVYAPEGAPIAEKLSNRVRSLDPTRPLTQAFPGATSGANADAAISKVDIAGYNYNLAQNQEDDHLREPKRIMMTTESYPADAFEQWSLVQEHPYIVGEFVWTAMDYLGESGVGAWNYGTPKQVSQNEHMTAFLRKYMASFGNNGKSPIASFQNGQSPTTLFPGFPWHAAYCGDIDLTGYRKPSSYYRDILWNGGDRVFATVRLPETDEKKIIAPGWSVYPTLPSWTWPGEDGKSLTVDVYSGTESVRLLLNGKLLGEKPTGRDTSFVATFEVPYAAGTLKAQGMRAGRLVAESVLETFGSPVRLKLTSDRTVLAADGENLAFVTVEAVDENGRLQMNSEQKVQFSITGAGTIVAVGNGDGQSRDSYAGNTFNLFHGRALVVLRAARSAGRISLTATAEGLSPSSLAIETKRASVSPELQ